MSITFDKERLNGYTSSNMEMINPHASKECIIQSLQWCVKMGHCDILQALLVTHFSQTKLSDMAELCSDILIRVVSHGSCDLLNLILPYVDDNFLSNENNKMGKNYLSKMLCHAVKKGNKPVVELLIEKGANVDSFFEGIPLLHVALNAGSSDIAKTLIVSGANVDTALVPAIFASFDDKEEVTQMILDHGADPNHSGETGRQPIHVAAAHSGSIVKRLVDIGCDVNTQDAIHGNTPLHIACSMCCTDIVESLIKCGAKFNMLNIQGETPLYKLLKFATDRHDFHSQIRLKLANNLVKLGFKLFPIKGQKSKIRHGRDKVNEVYTNILTSSKSVHTLQHLCRLKIRDNIYTLTINDSINTLDIPRTLISYLKFEDEVYL